MANTYTQLYVHVVFAVKGRANLVARQWKEQLYSYITGIIRQQGQKLMIINGMPDHVHILIGLKPDCNLSELVRDIKAHSSKWINLQKFVVGKFEWQTGFGAFSVSQSRVPDLVRYILNQEEHHRVKTFRDEYVDFLNAYQIDHKPGYLPEDYGIGPPPGDGEEK
ncbi:MAG: IS200/IS605 family transposase [Saprospiraceae bacterium]|nr:IS200/IS605 family transposase [Saprospiraceae bacterium]